MQNHLKSFANAISDNICNYIKSVVESEVKPYLENLTIIDDARDMPKGELTVAYSRVKVCIGHDNKNNPIYVWVGGNTQDERNDNVVIAYVQSGRIREFLETDTVLSQSTQAARNGHSDAFGAYADNWFEVFAKPNIEAATALTYQRQINLYWKPAFGDKRLNELVSTDIQEVLNSMGNVAKDTKKKALMVLSMILDQAVEDGIIPKNVSKSKTVKVKGRAAKETEPYSVEQMRFLVANIPSIQNPIDRAYLAIAALHPLRPEEIFGLKYKDLNREEMKIAIVRAVTYPDRNQPVIKATKTESSVRKVDLVTQIVQYLPEGEPEEFLFGGQRPLSYQQIRRMRTRIKKDIQFDDDIVPRRFRTTVLTDLYDATKDIKQTQAAAGHTTAEMTLRHYVKGRHREGNTAAPVANCYGL